jgi:hypothetical protein
LRTEALEIFRKRIADGILNRVQVYLRQKVFPVQLRFCLTDRNDFWEGGFSVGIQEPLKAEGKRRILDLRFDNVKVNAHSQRIHSGRSFELLEDKDINVCT